MFFMSGSWYTRIQSTFIVVGNVKCSRSTLPNCVDIPRFMMRYYSERVSVVTMRGNEALVPWAPEEQAGVLSRHWYRRPYRVGLVARPMNRPRSSQYTKSCRKLISTTTVQSA